MMPLLVLLNRLFRKYEDLDKLEVPDPYKAGRMPVVIKAKQKL